MSRYADEQLEYWGEIFRACRLHEVGVDFEAFLEAPEVTLAAHGQADAPAIIAAGFRPLLPSQVRLRAELDREEAACAAPLTTVRQAEMPVPPTRCLGEFALGLMPGAPA